MVMVGKGDLELLGRGKEVWCAMDVGEVLWGGLLARWVEGGILRVLGRFYLVLS